MTLPDPRELLGNIDIYLLDQVMRGRITPGTSVLDAGCGGGRNLRYFLRADYDTWGCDPNPEAIDLVRMMARELAPDGAADPNRYQVATLEEMPFEENRFDVVVCNAVLHFAQSTAQFEAMLQGAWRPLKPGGVFFARLTSSIGIETLVQPLGDGCFHLPDGSTRYLVDQAQLLALTEELGGELLDPIKTTNVQNLRCMTTWVLTKR